MIALLLAVLAADATVPRMPPPALTQDRQLRAQNAGYLRYLAAHPDLEKTEHAWWELQRNAAFRDAEQRFDEMLLGDIEAQTLFDRYYDRLHADAAARDAADALYRTEFSPDALAPLFSGAMRDLRADPRAALQQLQDTGGADLPDALAPMLSYLSENPKVLNELLGGLQGVVNDPPNAARITTPWWTQTAAAQTNPGAAYAALTRHFAQRPEAFWPWHRRHLALAADAQARDWIRYWHRLVRRTPGLAGPYYAWLSTQADPEQAGLSSKAAKQGDEHWPPKTAPPELAPLAVTIPSATTSAVRGESATRLTTPRPQRFQVQRPTRPGSSATGSIARPTPPTRPTRPSAR